MDQSMHSLEFNRILEMLCERAQSQGAKQALLALKPILEEAACVRRMNETTAARKLLDACGTPPLPSMNGLAEILTLCEAGAMLVPDQLTAVGQFAASCKRVKSYLKRAQMTEENISAYGGGIDGLAGLREEIDRSIRGEAVADEASPALRDLRRKIDHTEAQIKEKLGHILKTRKQYLSDSYISNRNGHFVLPVKKECRNQFGGTVIEVSGKGNTLFMEPDAVSKLQQAHASLEIEEDGEVRRILYTLTALVADYANTIRRNMEAMEVLDVLFAKAKLSADMDASPVETGARRLIRIRGGRHPLLEREGCVPLDFELDEKTAGVIITGPNTGGKTVAVKTVGLLTLMAQCGLHIPCGEGSYIAMQDACWCDIGDGQSISQNLSTFSGHMTNVINILEHASRDSLVLLDELGSGTDPAEGMGIAIAVLEELRARGCQYLVTTHYPQVKAYAESAPGVKSARMAFDRESLRPLYRLEMGKAGESCALHIARRLGLSEALLDKAQQAAYGQGALAAGNLAASYRAPKSRLRRTPPKRETTAVYPYEMGDSVTLLPGGENAIVFIGPDDNGDVIVQVKGKKQSVNHTRLHLKVPASKLYPPGYDFSIIFDTVNNRKARHKMAKRHDPTLTVQLDTFDR